MALSLALLLPGAAGAVLIDFDLDELDHGDVVDNQYQGLGVTISATNQGGGPDLSIIFDSTMRGTEDIDLEFAKSGNLAFYNILIIQEENDGGNCDDGTCDSPDDEGSRPAGWISFDFDAPVADFGLDILDIEGVEEFDMGEILFYVDGQADPIGSVDFEDLIDPNSDYYDPTIVFGDNSANRVVPIMVSDFGFGGADRIEVHLGGSGALDNVRYEFVPEPGTASLLGLGLLALGSGYRRSRKRS